MVIPQLPAEHWFEARVKGLGFIENVVHITPCWGGVKQQNNNGSESIHVAIMLIFHPEEKLFYAR